MAFFNGSAAKAEAEANLTIAVTTKLSASDAIKTVAKAYLGGLFGAGIGRSALDAYASGRESLTVDVTSSASGTDPSTAVLRVHVDTSWNGEGTRVILDVADYHTYSKFGMPLYSALSVANKRRNKAVEKLQPITMDAY